MRESDFLNYVAMDKKDFWKHCVNITKQYGHLASTNILLEFRRELQKGISNYSRKKDKMDGIQAKGLWMTEMILRWCRQYYLDWAKRSMIKNMPMLATNPQKLNGFVNNAWEQYVRKMSY